SHHHRRDPWLDCPQPFTFRAPKVTRIHPPPTFELPQGLFIRDGIVVKERDEPSFDTWFRWNAIARILVGAGLTQFIDGRWHVAQLGVQR
ncbi:MULTISPECIES: hypothetical protein, partial [Microbacterium]|uniref:hypothetical protein n=1 Tax=Microbacterium TaxID=33882 RepID=UPI00344E5F76